MQKQLRNTMTTTKSWKKANMRERWESGRERKGGGVSERESEKERGGGVRACAKTKKAKQIMSWAQYPLYVIMYSQISDML